MDAIRANKAKANTKTATNAKTAKRGKRCKRLNITKVRAISKAISKPCQDSVSIIWNSTKTSQHLAIFSQRKRFCELLDSELYGQLKILVDGLIADYATLYKPKTQYGDFQITWLDHVRCLAENGALLATSPAWQQDDTSSTPATTTETWANIYKQVRGCIGEIQVDTNFMVAHSIARSVFNHQQGRILEKKQNTTDMVLSNTSQQSPDDGLLRMCGAEISRMIRTRNKHVKRLKKHGGPGKLTAKSTSELLFLKKLCITPEEKTGTLQTQIPAGISSLDQTGYMWVPRLQLLPFLRKVDEVVRLHINEGNFQKHGENLFKIIQSQLNTQRDKLYSLFLSGLDEHFTDTETSKSIYTDLWGKMMNLRKEEWRASRERLLTHKEGKTSTTSLMLRDELKPHIARKKTR